NDGLSRKHLRIFQSDVGTIEFRLVGMKLSLVDGGQELEQELPFLYRLALLHLHLLKVTAFEGTKLDVPTRMDLANVVFGDIHIPSNWSRHNDGMLHLVLFGFIVSLFGLDDFTAHNR